jgi:uncharacterized protein YbjT (DUF2867 family)
VISVVGGNGLLGTALVPLLHERGETVRVACRGGRVSGELAPAVAEVVRADVRDPATLGPVVDGADVVVSAVHGVAPGDRRSSPRTVDVTGNAHLVDAAARAGADVVLLSVVGAGPGGSELQRAKWAAEQHLRASAARWTVVRASAYRERWEQVLRDSAGRSGRPVVLGKGTNPVNFVSVAEVAHVVADACLDPLARGRVLEVRGQQDLTLTDLARGLSAPGVSPRHVPRPLLRVVGRLAGPVRPDVARLARLAVWMDTADLRGGAGTRIRPAS